MSNNLKNAVILSIPIVLVGAIILLFTIFRSNSDSSTTNNSQTNYRNYTIDNYLKLDLPCDEPDRSNVGSTSVLYICYGEAKAGKTGFGPITYLIQRTNFGSSQDAQSALPLQCKGKLEKEATIVINGRNIKTQICLRSVNENGEYDVVYEKHMLDGNYITTVGIEVVGRPTNNSFDPKQYFERVIGSISFL